LLVTISALLLSNQGLLFLEDDLFVFAHSLVVLVDVGQHLVLVLLPLVLELDEDEQDQR
jgi:hypothetical protein